MGRARLRCARCEAVLGVWARAGLEVQGSVREIQVGEDGALWLVCRGCGERRRYVQGVALVKAGGAREKERERETGQGAG
jgi:hypothetical protein